MFKYECKKLYIKQYFIFLILISIILKLLFLSFNIDIDTNINEVLSNKDRMYISKIIDIIGGKLTNQKEILLNEEISENYKIKTAIDIINDDLNKGKYSSLKEYAETNKELLLKLNNKRAIAYIDNIFIYANQNRANHWIISSSLPFVENDNIDFVLLILIISMSTLIYFQENSSNMCDIIKTSTLRKKVSNSKLLLLFFSVVSTCIIYMCIDIIYSLCILKSDEIFYPIQSLKYFSNCSYNLNILYGIFIIWVLRIIGYLFLAFLTISILNLTKNQVVPITIILFIYFIEPFILKSNIIYYTPFGLVKSTGYIRGIGESFEGMSLQTGKTIVSFPEIEMSQTVFVILISIVFISIIIILYNKFYLNIKIKHNIKKSCIVMLSFLLCLNLTSCNTKSTNKNINSNDNVDFAQNSKYYFYVDNNSIKMVDKTNNKVIDNIIRNPMINNDNITIKSIFSTDKYLYYLISNKLYDEINRINLKTFSEKNILSECINAKEIFLGLSCEIKPIQLSKNIKKFFVNNDDIYIMTNHNSLLNYNTKNKKVSIILDDIIYGNNMSCDGSFIYYINTSYELKRFDMKSKKVIKLSEEYYNSLYLFDNKLYVTNLNNTFIINLNNSTTKLVYSSCLNKLKSDGKNIFFRNKDYKMCMLTKNNIIRLISDKNISEYVILYNTNNVYANYYKDGIKQKFIIQY